MTNTTIALLATTAPLAIVLIVAHFFPGLFCEHRNARLVSVLPQDTSAQEMEKWIKSDYDLYKKCSRCGHTWGVGERYE